VCGGVSFNDARKKNGKPTSPERLWGVMHSVGGGGRGRDNFKKCARKGGNHAVLIGFEDVRGLFGKKLEQRADWQSDRFRQAVLVVNKDQTLQSTNREKES